MNFIRCAALIACCFAGGQALAADAECTAIRAAFVPASADASAHFGMAFCAARDGDADRAFAFLASAAAKGYRNARHARSDTDFTALHGDPRWQGAMAAIDEAERRYVAALHPELYALYQADQGDRTSGSIDWSVVGPRDKARQQRVKELMDAGAARQSADYFHAAMVYQHGDTPAHYDQARRWALRAVELDPGNKGARWLACAAEDRYLHNIGKPQVWGTQYTKPNTSGVWTMEPFDRAAHTDEERAANGVQTLAQSAARLEKMNAVR